MIKLVDTIGSIRSRSFFDVKSNPPFPVVDAHRSLRQEFVTQNTVHIGLIGGIDVVEVGQNGGHRFEMKSIEGSIAQHAAQHFEALVAHSIEFDAPADFKVFF